MTTERNITDDEHVDELQKKVEEKLDISSRETYVFIKDHVNLLITERINLFHDALVKRGQIKPIPKAESVDEDRKE